MAKAQRFNDSRALRALRELHHYPLIQAGCMAETLTVFTEFSLPLPETFPHSTSPPRFNLGDQVCWNPLPSRDFGTIVGLQYAPASHLSAWAWRYVILLSPVSPSRAWVQADLAWEDDIRLQEFPHLLSP